MASNVDKDLIDQFMTITGASRSVAKSMLTACNGNLDMAIGVHMDAGDINSTTTTTSSGADSSPSCSSYQPPNLPDFQGDSEDDVRAPIPQKHETLIEETRIFGFRKNKRKTTGSVFDGFRDFKREIDQQSEHAASSSQAAKYRRLEDLFRPPIDIIFKGSFNAARDSGSQQNKWLMVNIQNVKEFPCQVLNRDVWSNHSVRAILNKSFLLWQVYNDSEEGEKYNQFYPVPSWPYIAIIDPRTGEKMAEWNKMDPMTFCDLVGDFLTRHPNPCGVTTPSPPPAKRQKRETCIIDSSEDSQLEAALAVSKTETKAKVGAKEARRRVLESNSEDSSGDEEEELETFSGTDDESSSQSPLKYSQSPKLEQQVCTLPHNASINSTQHTRDTPPPINGAQRDDQSQPTTEADETSEACSSTSQAEVQKDKWREFLGDEDDEKSTVLLKFPDGSREQLTLPASSQIRALSEFMNEKGYNPEKYHLLTHYPRKNISELDPVTSLKTAGLFPQETVFVHAR